MLEAVAEAQRLDNLAETHPDGQTILPLEAKVQPELQVQMERLTGKAAAPGMEAAEAVAAVLATTGIHCLQALILSVPVDSPVTAQTAATAVTAAS